MALNNSTKEKIATEVIKTLVSRFNSFPEDASENRNAPFHTAFLKAFTNKFSGKVSDIPFFISLSSWMHGLNTTLGQTFFENIAHHISNGEKREYTSKRLGNLKITQTQRNHISQIIAELSNSTNRPNLQSENSLLLVDYIDDVLINAMDFSADIFIQDDDVICAIELKSVKPNSGEMKGEKQKILEGKAALYRAFPGKVIKFYMGFPFDPTVDTTTESETSYNKDRFLGQIINMTKFFDKDKTLVGAELWDFLSDETQTMEQILEIINRISTVDFMDKYKYLLDNQNRNNPEFSSILSEWFLYSELELVANDAVIRAKINGNTQLTRIYNRQVFDNSIKKGSYRFDRYSELKELL